MAFSSLMNNLRFISINSAQVVISLYFSSVLSFYDIGLCVRALALINLRHELKNYIFFSHTQQQTLVLFIHFFLLLLLCVYHRAHTKKQSFALKSCNVISTRCDSIRFLKLKHTSSQIMFVVCARAPTTCN